MSKTALPEIILFNQALFQHAQQNHKFVFSYCIKKFLTFPTQNNFIAQGYHTKMCSIIYNI